MGALATFSILFVVLACCQAQNEYEINGYYLATSSLQGINHSGSSLGSTAAAVRPDALECPSENVITTTYRCQVRH